MSQDTPRTEASRATLVGLALAYDELVSRGYTIITPLENLSSRNDEITYVCRCNNEFTRVIKSILRAECKSCLRLKHQSVPTADDEKFLQLALQRNGGLLEGEHFKPIVGAWFSNKGRCISVTGKLLTLDEKGRYHVNNTGLYASKLLKDHFNITAPTTRSENLVSRDELREEEVPAQPRRPRNIEEDDKDLQLIRAKLQDNTIRSTKLPGYLPSLQIFDDGTIFNYNTGRFVSLTESYEGPGRKGYFLFTANGFGGLRLHRIICMAFNPIEGKNVPDGYDDLQVNHIDGDIYNNRASNLEWVTRSENIRHAYDNNLNRKCRPVLQYQLNADGSTGDFIAEHRSVAEGARATNLPEFEVRNICKGDMRPRNFVWKFKFEEQSEEWSKKYSVHPSAKPEPAEEKKPRTEIRVYLKLKDGSRGEHFGTYFNYRDVINATGVDERVIRDSCNGRPNRQKYIFERVRDN